MPQIGCHLQNGIHSGDKGHWRRIGVNTGANSWLGGTPDSSPSRLWQWWILPVCGRCKGSSGRCHSPAWKCLSGHVQTKKEQNPQVSQSGHSESSRGRHLPVGGSKPFWIEVRSKNEREGRIGQTALSFQVRAAQPRKFFQKGRPTAPTERQWPVQQRKDLAKGGTETLSQEVNQCVKERDSIP